MLVDSKNNVKLALIVTGKNYLKFFALAGSIGLFAEQFNLHQYLFPTSLVIIFASAVGIFLAFRINSGYGRWWEARTYWGTLVNDSRTFGSYVRSLVRQSTPLTKEEKELHRQLIYGHIALINALRLQLRRQPPEDWETELWQRKINSHTLFSQQEIKQLKQKTNMATQIAHLQSKKLGKYFNNLHDFRHLGLLDLLRSFYAIIGQCERIKNSTFPWGYGFYTHRLVWSLACVLPASQINSYELQNILLVALISTVFITVEQVGRNLDNPFENSFNDTPMTALCRVIEIDLLQQIDEPCDLKPIEVKNGRLD